MLSGTAEINQTTQLSLALQSDSSFPWLAAAAHQPPSGHACVSVCVHPRRPPPPPPTANIPSRPFQRRPDSDPSSSVCRFFPLSQPDLGPASSPLLLLLLLLPPRSLLLLLLAFHQLFLAVPACLLSGFTADLSAQNATLCRPAQNEAEGPAGWELHWRKWQIISDHKQRGSACGLEEHPMSGRGRLPEAPRRPRNVKPLSGTSSPHACVCVFNIFHTVAVCLIRCYVFSARYSLSGAVLVSRWPLYVNKIYTHA